MPVFVISEANGYNGDLIAREAVFDPGSRSPGK